MHAFLAISLFLAVLIFIVVQPRGLSIGWTAFIGGAVAIGLGLVTWADVGEVVHIVWDATLTFVALIIISLILDEMGFFKWAALHTARASRERGRRLFLLLGVLGAAVAMFFANDGAALILTPIVYEQTRVLKLDPRATLALIMASGFIADTTSVPLVVSNLVNIVSADYFRLGFVDYAVRMVPVDGVALLASLAMLFLFYRRDLPDRIAVGDLEEPRSAIRDERLFRISWGVLAFLLMGYFASQLLHLPVSLFAGSAALAFIGLARKSPAVSIRTVLREAPWKIVVFSIGMYVVVFGLRNVGLTHALSHGLEFLAQAGPTSAVVGTGLVAALLSSVMNNMPTVMIDALAIHGAGVSPALHTQLAYANIIGCDLGPKLTPIGSLATLLWLHVLERRGVRVSWGYYMRVGILLTIPVLLVTLTGLAVWGAVIG